MKRNVSLYIAGTKVDLDDNSLILFNYAMTDLTNPTIVKNSYSKRITLKGTKTNNKLFGSIFRNDRQIVYSSSYYGANFDPMRKTPFAIYDESGQLLESGYVKLDSVDRNGMDVQYQISLYGELGSFLYSLMYNEDGSKKTLADLPYENLLGVSYENDFQLANCKNYGHEYVKEAWEYLSNPAGFDATQSGATCWNIVNFMVAYNGFPADFDSNKAICKLGQYRNISFTSKTDEEKTYEAKTTDKSVLLKFANKHTEWEMRDLRWYLQRPIVSVKAIIEAIVRFYDNRVYLDETFFNENNVVYAQGWITLPMIAAKDRQDDYCLEHLLQDTPSPAEYLLSIIKTFGLMIYFLDDKIHIVARSSFFEQSQIIDFSNRIDKSSIKVNPVLASNKFYQLGGGAEGEFAEDYRNTYGVDYGVQKIDTGNEFNKATSKLTDGIIFQDAAEVQESNRMFMYQQVTLNASLDFVLPLYEDVKVELWSISDSQVSSKDFPIICSLITGKQNYDNTSYPFLDISSKMQFHGMDNAPISGSNVLVVYKGAQRTSRRNWMVSSDSTRFDELNDGKPCWLLSQISSGSAGSKYISEIPKFGRMIIKSNAVSKSLDWGIPKEIGIPSVSADKEASLYSNYWKAYLSDLYDDDTRVMNCKVNLRGLPVNQKLLGSFFWYENAIWVLNKISNYSLTTFDDAECEFIKVNDIDNYR